MTRVDANIRHIARKVSQASPVCWPLICLSAWALNTNMPVKSLSLSLCSALLTSCLRLSQIWLFLKTRSLDCPPASASLILIKLLASRVKAHNTTGAAMPSARKPDSILKMRLTPADNTLSMSLNTSYRELSATTSTICFWLRCPVP